MSATCIPWHVPCSDKGLSEHGVFLHFCPLNQNLARVRTRGGGYAIRGGGLLCPMIRHSARMQFIGLRCSRLASHPVCLLLYCSEGRL